MAGQPTRVSSLQRIAFLVAMGLTFVMGMGILWPSMPQGARTEGKASSGGCACGGDKQPKEEESTKSEKATGAQKAEEKEGS